MHVNGVTKWRGFLSLAANKHYPKAYCALKLWNRRITILKIKQQVHPKEIDKSSCVAYMVSVPWAFIVGPLKVQRHHLCLKCDEFYGTRLWTTNSQECMLLACGHYQRHTPLKTWFEPQAYAFHHMTLHVNGEKVVMDSTLRMVMIFGCYWRKAS